MPPHISVVRGRTLKRCASTARAWRDSVQPPSSKSATGSGISTTGGSKNSGFPPRRLHRVPAAHRRKFAADAEAWFTRKRERRQVAQIRREARPTKAQLRDEALKSPDAVQARITDAVRNMRTRQQLVTETLVTFGRSCSC